MKAFTKEKKVSILLSIMEMIWKIMLYSLTSQMNILLKEVEQMKFKHIW